MSDVSRDASVDGEAPVNPYSLLEAVNASSRSAHAAWLVFVAVAVYVLVAVAGVTHRDLFLANDVPLPVLNVRLELTRFFLFLPAALLLAHVALLAQLIVLARKSLELDAALQMVEATDQRSHPLRLELHNFFLVQAIAGPERSRAVGALSHALGWLTLAVLPVFALLFVQATFLPYHHAGLTWLHRALVLADIGLLIGAAIFLMRPEQSLQPAFAKAWRQAPFRTALVLAASLFGIVLTSVIVVIPGSTLDWVNASAPARPVFFGLIDRNLDVRDQDLASGRSREPGGRSLNLRERDLRHARLDRTGLTRADLTGADLDGASLIGAALGGVALGCAERDQAPSAADDGKMRCASGRGANFARANLAAADLSGADLTGARLAAANLVAARLIRTNLAGADLSAAHLDKADLREAILTTANATAASLVGVDLSKAALTGADLTSAVLRAAVLNSADLSGGSLRAADLEAAALVDAKLFAADLSGARIRAASLRDAHVWLARVPDGAQSALADFAGLDAKPPVERERDTLVRALEHFEAASRDELTSRLGGAGEAKADASVSVWAELVRASDAATGQSATVIGSMVPTGGRISGSEPPSSATVQAGDLAAQLRLSDRRVRVTRHLTELACQPRAADGAVATGLARRALGPGFNADPGALLESLRRPECAGGRAVPAVYLERLAGAAELSGTR